MQLIFVHGWWKVRIQVAARISAAGRISNDARIHLEPLGGKPIVNTKPYPDGA
jgi:hypothetical protein